MLKIEHSICPSCSVGCGLNIVSKNNEIVGMHPYKYHKINEGKNCNHCADSINDIIENKIKDVDYGNINEFVKLIKDTPNEKITILTSGNIENTDLNALIDFSNKNDLNLVSYEYNFTKINSELIPTYDEVEKAKTIITFGDIYRINPLLARRIVHAQDNGCKTINVGLYNTLTAINADEIIKSSFSDFANEKIDTLNLDENTIVIVNIVDSPENLKKLEEKVQEKNAKLLPILKHPNSYSVLEKTTPLTSEEINETFSNTDLLVCVDDDPVEYVGSNKLKSYDFDIVSITPKKEFTSEFSKVLIPVKAWCEKDGSFTNSMGLEQKLIDAVQNEDTPLLSVKEVLENIQKEL